MGGGAYALRSMAMRFLSCSRPCTKIVTITRSILVGCDLARSVEGLIGVCGGEGWEVWGGCGATKSREEIGGQEGGGVEDVVAHEGVEHGTEGRGVGCGWVGCCGMGQGVARRLERPLRSQLVYLGCGRRCGR
jgi:hypothetical protein